MVFKFLHATKTTGENPWVSILISIDYLSDAKRRGPRVTPVGELSLSRVLLSKKYNKDRRGILRGKRKAFFEKVSSERSCKRSQNATYSTTGSTRGYLFLLNGDESNYQNYHSIHQILPLH